MNLRDATAPRGGFSFGAWRLRTGRVRLAAALLLVSALPALHAAPLAPAGGVTLRWAAQGDLQSLDPHAQNESLSNQINAQVYESLIQRGKQLELVPALATAWTAEGPRRWRLTLRPGVRFHDGRPFSAEDVKFSVERAAAGSSDLRVYALALGSVKVIDPLTVAFELPRVNPVFLEHLSVLPIMSRGWAEANRATRPLDLKAREEGHAARHANGTGPYMLVRREADAQTVFRRNPAWWGKLEGNVEQVIFRPIANDATRTAALASGEVDFLLDLAPQDAERLRRDPALKLMEGPENRILFIGLDQARGQLLHGSLKDRNPFQDRRVRQALYQAIDIELIRTKLMRNLAWPTGALMPSPVGHGQDATLEQRLPYDLAAAQRLMAEAGYAEGFGFTLDCPNNRYLNDEQICLALASMWARLKVKVQVQAMPRTLFFPKLQRGDTSAYLLGWGGAITDAQITLTPLYHSPGADSAGAWNFGGVRNAALDGHVDAAAQEADPVRRMASIRAAVREFQTQVHALPLHRQAIVWAMRRNVQVVQRPDNWLEWQWVRVEGPAR